MNGCYCFSWSEATSPVEEQSRTWVDKPFHGLRSILNKSFVKLLVNLASIFVVAAAAVVVNMISTWKICKIVFSHPNVYRPKNWKLAKSKANYFTVVFCKFYLNLFIFSWTLEFCFASIFIQTLKLYKNGVQLTNKKCTLNLSIAGI